MLVPEVLVAEYDAGSGSGSGSGSGVSLFVTGI